MGSSDARYMKRHANDSQDPWLHSNMTKKHPTHVQPLAILADSYRVGVEMALHIHNCHIDTVRRLRRRHANGDSLTHTPGSGLGPALTDCDRRHMVGLVTADVWSGAWCGTAAGRILFASTSPNPTARRAASPPRSTSTRSSSESFIRFG